MFCKAHANPPRINYRWYLNTELVPENDSPYLVLENVTEALHNIIVQCTVNNSLDKSSSFKALDIKCKNKISLKFRSTLFR